MGAEVLEGLRHHGDGLMPQPRALSQLQRTAKAPSGASGVTITREVVEAVQGNIYTILGFRVPGTQVQAGVGDQVDVLWQRGKPQRVLNHEVRRGSAHIVDDEGGNGIVEELFIASNPKLAGGVSDIYFRNDSQVTPLSVGNDFATAPTSVFWGMNTDVFGVLAGSIVHVYRIDRPSLTKVLKKKAKIKVKLYSLDLLTAFSNLTISDMSFKWHRDTTAPYFKVKKVGTDDPTYEGTGTVTETANMTRGLTMKLTGLSSMFTEEVANTFSATVTNTVESILIDENNQVIIGLSMKITNLDVIQSAGDSPVQNPNHNLTNVTFSADTWPFTSPTPITIDTTYAPGVGDPIWSETDGAIRRGINPKAVFERYITPSLDFRMYFKIGEKHALVLNASTGTIVEATIDAAPTVQADDVFTGYRFSPGRGDEISSLRSFAFLVADSDTTVGGTIGNETHSTWNLTVDAGNMGVSGQTRSDGSLFTAGSPFDIPTKRKMFKRDTVTFFSGLDDTHPTLNYDFNGQPLSGGCAVNLGTGENGWVRVHWSASRQQVQDRYTVELTPQVFFSKGGEKYTFIKAIYRATHPGAGTYVDQLFTSFDPNADPHQIGVFVMVGTTVYKLLAPMTVTDPDTPIVKLLTGNAHRVIFRFNTDWYMSNLDVVDPDDATLRLTKKTGTNVSAVSVIGDGHGPGLVLMTPDLLYDAIEEQRKFIKGWNRTTQAITLNQATPPFPPPEAALSAVGTLINISKTLKDGSSSKNLHSIEDTSLLPKSLQETPTP